MAKKCTATSKRTGQQCGAWAAPGRDVCRWHGGTTPRGLAHPATTHGRFSKDLPTRILADYEAARTDPDLVALREEIAVVTAREADLARRVDTGEAGALWTAAQRAMANFRAAQRADDAPAAAAALRDLERGLAIGVEDYAAWDELLKVIDLRRRLADTERRRLEAIQESLSVERALLFASALVSAVRKHVADRSALGAIEREFAVLIGGGADAGHHQ